MLRPVRVIAPAMLPISLDEAKRHLVVTHAEHDDLILGFIAAAVDRLDGWTGILGRCLVEQTWRQDFDGWGSWHDGFARYLPLRLGPVIAVTSVTHRSADGTLSTVSPSAYALRTDGGGRSFVRFDRGFSFPSDLHESAAVSVTYRAGYETIPEEPVVEPGEGEPPDPPGSPAVPARSTVPAVIKVAIAHIVAHWYLNREAVGPAAQQELPLSAEQLLGTFAPPRLG